MPRKPIIRGPDLDSARRDFMTGQHLDGPARGMVGGGAGSSMSDLRSVVGSNKRMPKGRLSTTIRRATGNRRLN